MKEKTIIEKLKCLKELLQIKKSPSTKRMENFIESFYGINNMPIEFYELVLQKLNKKSILKTIMKGNIYKLISALKNNNESTTEIEQYLSPQTYFQIPKKRINKIVKLLHNLPQDKNILDIKIEEELQWKLRRRPTYQEQEYQEVAYKLYTCLGYENTLELINQKYGNVSYEQLHYFVKKIELNNMSETEQDILKNYLFGNKTDFNNPIRQMLAGKFIELFINFDYFYNNLPYFIHKIGTKFKQESLQQLLKERFLTQDPTTPEITGEIREDMLSSYYHKYAAQQTEEDEVIAINTKAYTKKLRNKYKSSIPQIELKTQNEIIPELLSLSEPRNLTHGYRSGNCFRINGDASILFSQFLDSEHMRILSFSTKEYKDYAMVLLMRNGNTIIAQGIETSKWVPPELTGKKLYDLTKSILKQIMDYMNKNGDEIVATIIGATNSNVSNYNSNILPFLVSPILENGNNYYNGISNYQCLLDTAPEKNISDIKLYIPEKRYFDKRELVLATNKFSFNPDIEKRIISLRFQRSQTSEGFTFYQEMAKHQEQQTICNKDWYITLFTDGTIDSFLSDTQDPRAKEEFQQELVKIYKK
ncbi:MAG: hypothetical protein J6C28_04945 [Bacilli bacterium]|nr:hypothetical protein [Bacilli bacterium]